MVEFRMPSLGADMEAGTLVEWLVKPGDRVKRGDVVAVVETQKGAIEIETFQAGQIEQILVDLKSKVPVGTPLARIRTDGEEKPAALAAAPPPAAPAAPPAAPPSAAPAVRATARYACATTPRASRRGGRARIAGGATSSPKNAASIFQRSPAAARAGRSPLPTSSAVSARSPRRRKRSARRGLISRRCARPSPPPWRDRSEKSRTIISSTRSTSPLASNGWPQKNATLPPDNRLLLGALAIKAVALAARRFPAFNGFYRDNKFEPAPAVHVGVAIAIRGGGLAAPALHDADRLSLDELMSGMRDLVQRTRAGRIRGSEMSDPTITVSSLGERGVEALYGIIYPPQVAIVGFGKAVVRPWVVDGAIGPRSVITITLSGDHRVSDGHAGALFLAEIGKLLQEPDKL